MPATTETPVLYSTGGLFPPSSDKIEASLCVVMRQFHWSGYGISTKFIEDKGYALKISGLLQDAPETGKILPALSEDEEWVTENSGFLPAKPGTLWIDTQNGYFRLTDDYSSLCRVENHLGERTRINNAHFMMVALDENDKPRRVPGLILQTDDERLAWEHGEERRRIRNQRKKDKLDGI